MCLFGARRGARGGVSVGGVFEALFIGMSAGSQMEVFWPKGSRPPVHAWGPELAPAWCPELGTFCIP